MQDPPSLLCRAALRAAVPAQSAAMTPAPTSVRPLRGIVFDMDGTLTVPAIDFNVMYRRVLGDDHPHFVSGNPVDILHEIEQWSPEKQEEAYAIITECEKQAHERLQIMPGASNLCELLDAKGIRRGLITRNVKESVDLFHSHFGVVCGNRAGAVTCLLDEANRYEVTKLPLEQRPDFKVKTLLDIVPLLETNFKLEPVSKGD